MFSCSQCSFTANFESALMMHRQLYHEAPASPLKEAEGQTTIPLKPAKPVKTPRETSPSSTYSKKVKGLKLGSRTSSATRILGKLRAKICRSKVLCTHQEDPLSFMLNSDFSCRSECTSKALHMESPSRTSAISPVREAPRETYACHMCSFEADRITVLDRHLLNDHKIGLENLLKLVLAKTQDGLTDDSPRELLGTRQPYYKVNEVALDDGEFVIETTTPKIKILKHAATNTELIWREIPDLRDNCQMITKELDRLIRCPARMDKNDLLDKMQTLNDYMCKFVNSSNTLKKVLSRDTSGKHSARENFGNDEPFFDLRLEDQDTPRSTREWERAHSEKLERYKSKHSGKYRSDKTKLSAESYYF